MLGLSLLYCFFSFFFYRSGIILAISPVKLVFLGAMKVDMDESPIQDCKSSPLSKYTLYGASGTNPFTCLFGRAQNDHFRSRLTIIWSHLDRHLGQLSNPYNQNIVIFNMINCLNHKWIITLQYSLFILIINSFIVNSNYSLFILIINVKQN